MIEHPSHPETSITSTTLGRPAAAVVGKGRDGRIISWSHEARRLFGYTVSEAIGEGPSFVPREREEEERRLLASALSGHAVDCVETVRLHKDGHPVDVSLSIVPMLESDGACHSLIELYTESGEAKRLTRDAAIRRHHIVMADRMDALSALVGGVAHEINNPTSLISLNVPLLREMWERALPILDAYYEENGDFAMGSLPYSQMRDYVPKLCGTMLEGAGKISRIVNSLRDFARATPPGELEDIEINTVVMSATTLLSNVIRKATSRFVIRYERKLPTLPGHFQSLEQVVINLILNACQALPSPSCGLSVETRYDAATEAVGVVVSDEGCGIPPDVLPHITEPFFTTGREAGRTGLGLAVAATIVREHGGRLDFVSEPGCGTRVSVWLPAPSFEGGKAT